MCFGFEDLSLTLSRLIWVVLEDDDKGMISLSRLVDLYLFDNGFQIHSCLFMPFPLMCRRSSG